MNITNILNVGLATLRKNKVPNAQLDAEILLSSSIKRNKKHIILNPKELLNLEQVNKFKSLIDGYQSIRKLSKEELFYLPLLSQAAALRFLLTRIYDWAHTPKNANVIPKNPKEYIQKMRFHETISNNKNYGEIQ